MFLRSKYKVPYRIAEYERHIPDHEEYIKREFRVDPEGYATIDMVDYDGME